MADPPHIIEALGGPDSFDLDPCAHPKWATAKQLICLPDDGLTAPWHGRVWLNPPYGNQTWEWMERLGKHQCGTALIFARTETSGFIRTVWKQADAILFLAGRLHFHREDGTRAAANSGAPSCLVAYGDHDTELLAASNLAGQFIDLRQAARAA